MWWNVKNRPSFTGLFKLAILKIFFNKIIKTAVQDSQKQAESANQKVQQLLGELSEFRKEASQEKVNKNALQTL